MTKTRINRIVLAAVAFAALGVTAISNAASAQQVLPAEGITFAAGPGTLPAGVEFAVLHGSPAEEGPFVLRLKFPAGYGIPAHFHPEEEHVTVISGAFGVGAGDRLDPEAVTVLQPGSFVQIPAGMPHFAYVREETVVQINAMGPFGIAYVNEADDPRIN